MVRTLEEFTAQAANGQTFTIRKWHVELPAGELDNPDDTIPGLPNLQTSAGQDVRNCGNGLYEIRPLGLKVRRTPYGSPARGSRQQ
jgi:hypothetical protein